MSYILNPKCPTFWIVCFVIWILCLVFVSYIVYTDLTLDTLKFKLKAYNMLEIYTAL